MADGPNQDELWLVEYRRLFLVPPVPVTLNTGLYLEGGLAGHSAQMMAQCYATAGIAIRETFRDLPDHVVVQLEFAAALLSRVPEDPDALEMASEYARDFIAGWAGPLANACSKAAERHPSASAYAALAAVLQRAVDQLST